MKQWAVTPIGPFRELKIRLFDQFGFVANRPQIRSAFIGRTNCAVDILVILVPVFDRLPRVSEGEKPILIQALLPQSAFEAFNESIVNWLAWRLSFSQEIGTESLQNFPTVFVSLSYLGFLCNIIFWFLA